MNFPLVIHQKPTILEIFFITIILAITFIPFAYGIKTKQPVFCLSMIVGIICLKLYNIATKGKFTLPKIIQKTISISFSQDNIEINENQNSTVHNWSDLQEIEIDIFAYRGRVYGHDENHHSKSYDGIENTIKFIKNGQKFKYRFYIENVDQFKSLKEQFHKTILPQLEQYQNLKEVGYLKSQLNFARNYNSLNNDVDYL
ncbi:hypothetical protein EOD40_17245 [Flavobacterium sufflavum]|uniref:Uncharacterized protein n=1 Tax=Flavobacterium sufflavum TaxID=1921138 RepID=A0A437KL50_9FLAO|nr:hypothetical protein [Flavobacterium sufflavum]RVT71385.1 hypothetical protein EOD40_17245 [Flavobacterium sufflavum]